MSRRSSVDGERPRPERWTPRLGTLAMVLALTLPGGLAAPAGAAESGAAESGAEAAAPQETAVAHASVLPERRVEPSGFSHRQYYSTWRDARSYWSQDSRYPTGGWLWAGRHAFFCQVEGEPHSDGEGGFSTWWALTDDETGNRDVFVSATAFRVSEPWQPIEGLPRC